MSETLPTPSIEAPNPNIDHSMDNWNAFKAKKAEEERDKSGDNWEAFKTQKAEEARDKSMDNWNAFKATKAEEARDKSGDKWNEFLAGKSSVAESTISSPLENTPSELISTSKPETTNDVVEKESQNESVIQLNILAEAIAEFDKKVKSGDVKLKDKEILDKLNETFQDIYDEVEAAGVSDKTLENVLEAAYSVQNAEPATAESEKITDPIAAFDAVKTTAEVSAEKANNEIIDPVAAFDAVKSTAEAAAENNKLSETVNEKDAESLPEQEKSIVKAALDRARDLYYKAGSIYGSAAEKTSEFFFSKQRALESPWEYESRLKHEVFFKAIGLTALAAAALIVGQEISQSVASAHSVDLSNNLEPSAPVGNTVEFSNAAQTVVPGEGFYQTFKDMGIPKEEWGNIIHKVGPALQKLGLAYPVDGSYGFSQPGQLSEDVLKLIQNSR